MSEPISNYWSNDDLEDTSDWCIETDLDCIDCVHVIENTNPNEHNDRSFDIIKCGNPESDTYGDIKESCWACPLHEDKYGRERVRNPRDLW